jgi:hypothetical protein
MKVQFITSSVIVAGNIFTSLAERIRNGGLDGIACARTIAIHGRIKAKAESKVQA